MVTRPGLLVGLVCLSLTAGTARAADGDVVEGTGQATVRNGDTVAAKKEATTDALKQCIEKVVGISIQSEFSHEQRAVVDGNREEYFQNVRDSITQKAEGFIESYEVTGESLRGAVMSVTVRARVFESKVKAKARELAELIARAGNPKLMLVIQEVYVDTEGRKRVAKESSVAGYLEKELLAKGFELRGAKAAKNVADDSIDGYDKWLDDAGGAASMARELGADILIAGRVEVVNKGKIVDAAGLEALVGQTRIEIRSLVRGVNAASGEVFSSKPVNTTSVGLNQERALHRALQGRGANVIKQTFDQLLADLKESFRKTADQGQTYLVYLKGVSSFRKQGQPFVEAVKSVSGVSSVKQRSFAEGVLVLDVSFKGSLSELQDRIFSSTSSADGFSSLDVEGISGKQISLKL